MGTVHLILAALLGVHFAAAQRAPVPDGGGASSRIINGTDAKEGQFPFMMRLRMKDGEDSYHHCGGALIGSNEVLTVLITAAHCVVEDNGKKIPLDNLEVIAGDYSDEKEDGEDIRNPIRIIVHEDYYVDPSGVPVNDLALIAVKEKFDVRAINIAIDNGPYAEGNAVTVAGWGVINADEKDADKLQYLDYKIANEELCYKYWQEEMGNENIKDIIADGMFCAIDPKMNSSSGPGDSGGPVFGTFTDTMMGGVSLQLLGLVSWGTTDLTKPTFNMNVNLHHYATWISESSSRIALENEWPEIVGGGSNGPVVFYGKNGQIGTICNGGVSEREISKICEGVGYKMGMRAKYQPRKGDPLPPFLWSSLECSGKFSDCKFEAYPGKVPCFDGDQLAVNCYNEAWDFEVTAMMPTFIPVKGTAYRRGRIFVYVEAKKYGLGLDMKDKVQVSLAIAKNGGMVPLKSDMKYKRRKGFFIAKFKKDHEITEETCFYSIAWVRCTMFYSVGTYTEQFPDNCPSVDNLRDNVENWIKAMNDSNCKED